MKLNSDPVIMTVSYECRKWMVLVAAIWIQAFAGTNFDFPSYSTQMKSSLEINQVQLLYLAMASDIGKLFGWCSGILMLWFPTWVVLFMAACLGLFGYGVQWLIVCRQISVPYFVMFILSLLAGGSIPWFNTVCFVVNINNFPENWPLAVSLSVSFNGVTAALYNLLTTKIFPNDKSTSYLLLNAIVPFIVAIAALGPILQQPGSQNHQTDETVIKDDAHIFVCLYILAAVSGLYLFFLDLKSQNIYIMSILLIILPFISPSIIYLIKKVHRGYYYKQQPVKGPSYNLVELEHHEEFPEECITPVVDTSSRGGGCGFNEIIEQDQLRMLGEEHSATNLVSRCDFWLYYIAYFCGGTIGLVYSNNLGQVVESLGYISMTKALVTTYSTCSFFGRLLSGAADLVACFYHQTYTGMYSTRTGRLSLALVPMPFAFVLLILSDRLTVLRVATGLIGICSGFLVSTAVTITSELFGSESSRINHNILITNIPLGSLIYSVTASLVYDGHIRSSKDEGTTVCIGRKCYYQTFILWGCVSLLGLVSSFLLSLRTKPAYERYYKERRSKQPSISDGL